jgi:hypothetical protein
MAFNSLRPEIYATAKLFKCRRLFHEENSASITEISQLRNATPILRKFERRTVTGLGTDAAIRTYLFRIFWIAPRRCCSGKTLLHVLRIIRNT